MSRSPSPDVVDPPTSAAPTINPPETSAFTPPKTTTTLANNDSYYLELAKGLMANRFVGPMPVDEFLNKFLPPPADLPPSPCAPTDRIFDDMFILNGEPHALFIDVLRKHGLCPNLVLTDTNHERDRHHRSMPGPHISIYKADAPPTIPSIQPPVGPLRWADIELGVQFFPTARDPFSDAPGTHFEAAAEPITHARGRLIAEAVAALAYAFRTAFFSVCVLDAHARLLRWDHAGCVVSAKFDFARAPRPLVEFFWRFAHASGVARGRDPSVIPLSETEAAAAADRLRVHPSLCVELRVIVPRKNVKGKGKACDKVKTTVRRLAGVLPQRLTFTPWVASATRRCPAVDLASGEVVWVKDTWMIDTDLVPGIPQVYALMRAPWHDGSAKAKTAFVPWYERGHDVLSGELVQRSRSNQFLVAPWARTARESGQRKIAAQRHRREIVRHDLRPLSHFNSTKEMVSAFVDAIKAHQVYYYNWVLHGDINPANMPMTRDGKGLLFDLDYGNVISSKPIRADPKLELKVPDEVDVRMLLTAMGIIDTDD